MSFMQVGIKTCEKHMFFFSQHACFMIEHQDKHLQMSFIQVDVKHHEKHMFFSPHACFMIEYQDKCPMLNIMKSTCFFLRGVSSEPLDFLIFP